MRRIKLAALLSWLVTAALLQACVHAPTRQHTEAKEPSSVQPVDYAADTAKLESLLNKSPGNKERISSHLRLATIYRSWDNPGKDYEKALYHLGRYASLVPEKDRPPGVTDWLAALAERDRQLHELASRMDSLKDENARLTADNEGLEDEIDKLREKIESLKHLDLKVEEKRRNFK